MAKNLYILHLAFLVASCLLDGIHATAFNVMNSVPNHPGGKVFDTYIGIDFVKQSMPIAQNFIYKIFEQHTPAETKPIPYINLYISDYPGYGVAIGYNINISARVLDTFYYPRNRSKFFFTSVLYHEMAHVYQWNGGWKNTMLLEGIADYVMVKSRVFEEDKHTKPGAGSKWDQGYGVTERFLEYCDSLRKGFTAELNKKMKNTYSDQYFKDLLGKPVDQLWREYKAKYGNKPASLSDSEDGGVSSMFGGLPY